MFLRVTATMNLYIYQRHEREKRRAYSQRISEIEHASFSPIVFSATGGMGCSATTMYQRLAAMIADKRKQDYNHTLMWIRTRLSFALLRAAIMCLRGSRPKWFYQQDHDHVEAILAECQMGRANP